MIRSDNGTEFKNYTLNDFLSNEGIHHQYSSPYTPQQNGVAERKNRTLIDMARTMLAEFKYPYNFWAEAIHIACHTSNRLYLRKGLNNTPYEILIGNKPNIKYFQVFGCKCYYLKKDVHLSKFDSKALEGTFVGYATESHAFRIFDKESACVVEVSNMRFDENDGSHVEQRGVFDVGDEIPPRAIRRWVWDISYPLRNTFWRKEKGYALLKWSLHPLKHNKLYKARLMLAKDKLKTLNQLSMIKIKTMCIVVILHQMVIKIKLKMMSKLNNKSKLKMKVKVRTKTVLMTKWLLKSLLKKLKLAVLRR
jgi:hypothetical protein